MEGFAYPIGTGLGRGSVYSGVGHALVRSSPIPEPVAMVIWLLLGLGVLTLLGWSKKETETTAS